LRVQRRLHNVRLPENLRDAAWQGCGIHAGAGGPALRDRRRFARPIWQSHPDRAAESLKSEVPERVDSVSRQASEPWSGRGTSDTLASGVLAGILNASAAMDRRLRGFADRFVRFVAVSQTERQRLAGHAFALLLVAAIAGVRSVIGLTGHH